MAERIDGFSLRDDPGDCKRFLQSRTLPDLSACPEEQKIFGFFQNACRLRATFPHFIMGAEKSFTKRDKVVEAYTRSGALMATEKLQEGEKRVEKLDVSLLESFRSLRPIKTIADMKRHLQLAIGIEHATLPPYLAALYTLQDSDHQTETYATISRIVYEEMLHFALACNLLNAINGQPQFRIAGFVPRYPCALPGSDGSFEVSIEKASDNALRTFERIELPQYPIHGESFDKTCGYKTIGEFYTHVRFGFEYLNIKYGHDKLFSGAPSKQLMDAGSIFQGRLVVVKDLCTALQAIDRIVVDGEGTHPPTPHQPGDTRPHYYAFKDIRNRSIHGTDGHILPPAKQFDPRQVEPMVKNPRLAGGKVKKLSGPFNDAYWELLGLLEETFNGFPEKIFDAAAQMMYEVRPKFWTLVRTPIGDGSGENAGPTFEFESKYTPSLTSVEKSVELVMRDPEVNRQSDFRDQIGGPIVYPNGPSKIVRKWDVTIRFNTTVGSTIQVKVVQTYTNGGGPTAHFDFPSRDNQFQDTEFVYQGQDDHGCIVLERRSISESIYPEFIPANDPFPDPNNVYQFRSVRENGRWFTLEWDIHHVNGQPQLTMTAKQRPWVADVTLRVCPT
jgi:hypothetical protein